MVRAKGGSGVHDHAEVVERVNNTRWIHILTPLFYILCQVRAVRQCLVSECWNSSQAGPEAGGWNSLVKLLAGQEP